MTSGPITVAELTPLINAIWRRSKLRCPWPHPRPTIGLCVSGGPDSMALAYLMRQIQRREKSRNFGLKAFIIDHGVRDKSADEANAVSERLRELGIDSNILKMDWLPGQCSSLENFESIARIKRYRMLANASIQAGIKDLLTGHHEDDQVETILMRLLRSSNAPFLALQGMAASSPIPCCENIFGARHEAFEVTRNGLVDQARRHEHDGQPGLFSPPPINDLNGKIAFHSGGIELHRPFLSFSKSRILETCKIHRLQYVNDKTNFDPKLTTRNALRFLRSNYELPRALSGRRILDLQKFSRMKLELLRQRARSLINAVTVVLLDLRSGSMTVRLPKKPETDDSIDVAYMLARVLQLVSPKASDDESTLVKPALVRDMFPLFNREPGQNVRQLSNLNAEQVLLQPLYHQNETGSPFTTWRISRQPLRSREVEDLSIHFLPDADTGFSTWLTWDERYWIRIQCLEAEHVRSIAIRPYTEADALAVKVQYHACSNSVPNKFHRFKKILNKAAPGNIRYTLPVLADEKGVLAFPTLGIKVPSGTVTGEPNDTSRLIGWEVRYKSINKELLDSEFFSNASKTSQGQ